MKPVKAQVQKRVVFLLTNSSSGHPALLSVAWIKKKKKTLIDNKLVTQRRNRQESSKHVSLHSEVRLNLTCPSGWGWRSAVPDRKRRGKMHNELTAKLMRFC